MMPSGEKIKFLEKEVKSERPEVGSSIRVKVYVQWTRGSLSRLTGYT